MARGNCGPCAGAGCVEGFAVRGMLLAAGATEGALDGVPHPQPQEMTAARKPNEE